MRRLLGSTGRGTSVPSAFLLVTPSTTTLRTDTSTSTILPEVPLWSPRSSLTSSPVMTVIERRLYFSRSSSERWLAICLRAWWCGALARARRCLRGCDEEVRFWNLEWDELFMCGTSDDGCRGGGDAGPAERGLAGDGALDLRTLDFPVILVD